MLSVFSSVSSRGSGRNVASRGGRFSVPPSPPKRFSKVQALKHLLSKKDKEIFSVRAEVLELEAQVEEQLMIAVQYRNVLENFPDSKPVGPMSSLFMVSEMRTEICMLEADIFFTKHGIEKAAKVTQASEALFVYCVEKLISGGRTFHPDLGFETTKRPISSSSTVSANLSGSEIENLEEQVSGKDDEIVLLRSKVSKLKQEKEEAHMLTSDLCEAPLNSRTMEAGTPLMIDALKARISVLKSALVLLEEEMKSTIKAKNMWIALFYALRNRLVFHDLIFEKIKFEATEAKDEHKALCNVLFSKSVSGMPCEHVKHVMMAIGDFVESLD